MKFHHPGHHLPQYAERVTQARPTTHLTLDELSAHLGVEREAARLWLGAYQTVTGEALPRGRRRAWLAPVDVADLLARAVATNRAEDLSREEAIREQLDSPPPGGGLEEVLATALTATLEERLAPFLDHLERTATSRLESVGSRLDHRVTEHLNALAERQGALAMESKAQLLTAQREALAQLDGGLKLLGKRYSTGVEEVERAARKLGAAERELVALTQRLDASTASAQEATLTLRTSIRDLVAARRDLRGDRSSLAQHVAFGAGIGAAVGGVSAALTGRAALGAAQHGVGSTVVLILGLGLGLVAAIVVAVWLLRR